MVNCAFFIESLESCTHSAAKLHRLDWPIVYFAAAKVKLSPTKIIMYNGVSIKSINLEFLVFYGTESVSICILLYILTYGQYDIKLSSFSQWLLF